MTVLHVYLPCTPSLSVFAEVGVTDLRSDVEIGRLDLQLGGLIDCCSFRARSEYQVIFCFDFIDGTSKHRMLLLYATSCQTVDGHFNVLRCAEEF